MEHQNVELNFHQDIRQVLDKNITKLDRQDVLNKNYIRQLDQIDQYLEEAESALTLMKEKHAVELKHSAEMAKRSAEMAKRSEELAKRSEELAKRSEELAKQREAFIQQQLDSIEQHLQQSQTELNRATEILRTMRNAQTKKSE